MSRSFYQDKLDWTSRGYFAGPTPPDDPVRRADRDAALWEELERIVEQAKAGDFGGAPRLLALFDEGGVLFRSVCCKALGDIGTTSCFEAVIRRLQTDPDIDRSLELVQSLHEWGSLAAVPVLVDEYDKFQGSEGAHVLPLFLSDLLEPTWGPISDRPDEEQLDAWEEMVLQRHQELRAQLGSDRVLVRHGEVFDVTRLARRMLERLAVDDETAVFHYKTRRLFEANTGIDCTSFYANGWFQPLAAAVILERFLASPEALRYEEGVRYFFGHRIPE